MPKKPPAKPPVKRTKADLIVPAEQRPGPRPKTVPQLIILPAALASKPAAPEETAIPVTPPPEFVPTGNGYEPTTKQRLFLNVVQDLVMSGDTHPIRWIQAFNATPGRPRLEVSEFRKWKEDPKFNGWFYGEITYEPDAYDKKLMAGEVDKRIMDGVKAGDARFVKEAVDTLGKRKRAAHDTPASVGEELQAFRAAGQRGHVKRGRHGLSMDDEATG